MQKIIITLSLLITLGACGNNNGNELAQTTPVKPVNNASNAKIVEAIAIAPDVKTITPIVPIVPIVPITPPVPPVDCVLIKRTKECAKRPTGERPLLKVIE